MTVGQLLRSVSARELTEWMEFEALHGPLGQKRDDWHAAQIAAYIVNANRGKKGPLTKIKDVLLKWAQPKSATSDKDMEALARQLAATHGGRWRKEVK